MIVETKYKCEVCGTEYDNEKECYQCENKHVKPISLDTSEYEFKSRYPKIIYMRMGNGAVCGYKLNSIVEKL